MRVLLKKPWGESPSPAPGFSFSKLVKLSYSWLLLLALLLPSLLRASLQPSGVLPLRLDLKEKRSRGAKVQEFLELGDLPSGALEPAQKLLRDMGETVWELRPGKDATMTGKEQNAAQLKPGVQASWFLFSSRKGTKCVRFPRWKEWEKAIVPLLEFALRPMPREEIMKRIVRLQLARMKGDADIKPHADTGPWAKNSHRVHVPVLVPKEGPPIDFKVGLGRGEDSPPIQLPIEEGKVFEVNNVLRHRVSNKGGGERVHLVADWSEEPCEEFMALKPDAYCDYQKGIECDEDWMSFEDSPDRQAEEPTTEL